MKYNIGDRVQTKLTRTPGTVRRISNGLVAVETDDPNVGVPLHIFEIQHGLFLSADAWEKISPSKIVVTSDGKTTLARLYDGSNVTKSAEAKCSPSDTYDFTTGANLAYDRLMRPTPASVKPQDKPKFKVGDKAKVVANSGNPRHFFEVGQIVNIDEVHQRSKGEWCARCTCRNGDQTINLSDLEPYAEHAKEPVKLYCVKDFMSGDWFTKGKVYETNQNDQFTTDSGYHPDRNEWDDNWTLGGYINWSDLLVPLVARPAKAGEWVYIAKSPYLSAISDGAVLRVINANDHHIDVNGDTDTQPWDGYLWHVIHSDYLTLDGYDGRYEQTEPKYFSGKVVCVETHDDFTVGKVYTFKDGKVNDNQGVKRPMNDYHAKTLESWNEDDGRCHTKFIEYKGEAT